MWKQKLLFPHSLKRIRKDMLKKYISSQTDRFNGRDMEGEGRKRYSGSKEKSRQTDQAGGLRGRNCSNINIRGDYITVDERPGLEVHDSEKKYEFPERCEI